MTDATHTSRTIHAKKSGFSVPFDNYSGRVLYANETVTLTPEQVAGTYDRNGVSWLDLTEEQQIEKWTEVRFGNGPAPEGAEIGADDPHGFRYKAYERARKLAEQFSDPFDRKVALRKVAEDFPEQGKDSGQRSAPYRDS